MSDKARITADALTAIDETMGKWRKLLYSECRTIALENGKVVNESVVREALASIPNRIVQEMSHHGKKRAG